MILKIFGDLHNGIEVLSMLKIQSYTVNLDDNLSDGHIINLIKDELWITKEISTRLLKRRIAALTNQNSETVLNIIERCIEQLTRQKEILTVQGGILSRAPVRIYKISQSVYRVVGGPSQLPQLISDWNLLQEYKPIKLEANRLCGFLKDAETLLQEFQMRDKQPPMLSRKLELYSSNIAETSQFRRWVNAENGTLWRYKEGTFYRYAITTGESPNKSISYSVDKDEAIQYMFALDRKNNNPIGIRKVEGCIEIEGSLPNGFFKYLLLCFQYPQFENGMYKYRLKEMPEEFSCNHEVISEVMRTLSEKLM